MESQIYLKSIYGDTEIFNSSQNIFSDKTLLKYLFEVEIALVKVQSDLILIPSEAYHPIKSTAESDFLD